MHAYGQQAESVATWQRGGHNQEWGNENVYLFWYKYVQIVMLWIAKLKGVTELQAGKIEAIK